MTTWTQVHSDEATLIARAWFKVAGTGLNLTVPAGALFVKAVSEGCGGQGDHWGGGGALALAVEDVAPGDNLVIQVGTTSTAGVLGDSFVKRNDGTVICYADRGRGNGTKGLASNSIGDITRDGGAPSSGIGGNPATDDDLFGSLGFGGIGRQGVFGQGADPGGGGLIATGNDFYGGNVVIGQYAAGYGRVCLEFYDTNPG